MFDIFKNNKNKTDQKNNNEEISFEKKLWISRAPANIALIKYMGKKDDNIPYNSSLSYTLDNFFTEVIIEQSNNSATDLLLNDELSEKEKNRFLIHLQYIKSLKNFNGYFTVRSKNSFPRAAGIASSASSFAALTKCAFRAISDIMQIEENKRESLEYMSQISRKGSGSSCRSFFSPWCIWRGEKAEKADISLKLKHEIILVKTAPKKVSSSEAHELVKTSLLMKGRAERAEIRCEKLINALQNRDNQGWSKAYQICWEEFFDMHALFETSNPHFGYILPETLAVLIKIRNFWNKYGDGPIVTVDAGPNIHLLWKDEEKTAEMQYNLKNSITSNKFGD